MKTMIVETVFPKMQLVENKGGNLKVRGIASTVDSVNGNGRVYPKAIMEREIERIQPNLSNSNHIGTVDHPLGSPSVSDLGLKFNKLWMEDNNVWFEGEVIPTSRGKDLEAILRAGVKVGISSRGLGSSKVGRWLGEDAIIIQDDFELESYDVVVNPSVAGARITQYESEVREAIHRLEEAYEKVQAVVPENLYSVQQTINSEETMEDINEIKKLIQRTQEAEKKDKSFGQAPTPVAAKDTPTSGDLPQAPEDQRPLNAKTDKFDAPGAETSVIPQDDVFYQKPETTRHDTPDQHLNRDDHGRPTVDTTPSEPEAPDYSGTTKVSHLAPGEVDETPATLLKPRDDKAKTGLELSAIPGEIENAPEAADTAQPDDSDARSGLTKEVELGLVHPNNEDEEVDNRIVEHQEANLRLRRRVVEAERQLFEDKNLKAAIASLSTAIGRYTSEGKFDIVADIARSASTLNYMDQYLGESLSSADLEVLRTEEGKKAAQAIVAPFAIMAERIQRDDLAIELTANEKYGRTIMNRLRTECKTAADVKSNFDNIRIRVMSEATGISPTPTIKGKLEQSDKDKLTPQQLEQRRLVGLR